MSEASMSALSTAPTIADAVAIAASRHPDRLALADPDGQMSWAGLETASSNLARGLLRRGLSPGDRVAILSENSVDFILTICAIWKAGGALAPLSTFLQPEAIAAILNDCDAAMLVASGRYFETLAAASSATGRGEAPPVVRISGNQ